MTREEIVKLGNEAIEKAQKDPEFKKKLISDANMAVKELTGKDLPIKFTVHDTDAKHLVFILPEVMPSELNDDSLSEVSGGWTFKTESWPMMTAAYAVRPSRSIFDLEEKSKTTSTIKMDWGK